VLRVLALTVPLLVAAAFRNADRLNTDAVAYLGLARHYAAGDFRLALSAYWGPLLPWLLAPLLKLGPLAALRAAMALGGLLFVVGAGRLLASLRVRSRAPLWICAAFAVTQSVAVATPDLLFCGLLFLSLASLLRGRWFSGGVWGGAGGLAKPVGGPTLLLLAVAVALLRRAAGARRTPLWRGPVLSLLGASLLLVPWIAALSIARGRLEAGSAGAINHAIVGPSARLAPFEMPRHPFTTTVKSPEPGRFSRWEDPRREEYPRWSPLEHPLHQARLLRDNLGALLWFLSDLDLLHLAWVGALLLFRIRPRERWRWGAPLAFAAVAVYLPVYASSARYCFPALPLLAAACSGGSRTFSRILLLSLALPWAARIPFDLAGRGDASVRAARAIAPQLDGPVAGDSAEGLFAAAIAGRPWHGAHRGVASVETLLASGARWAVVGPDSPLRAELEMRFEPRGAWLFRIGR